VTSTIYDARNFYLDLTKELQRLRFPRYPQREFWRALELADHADVVRAVTAINAAQDALEPGEIVPVAYVNRKDGTRHVFHFTFYLSQAGSNPAMVDDLDRVWLAGALLAIGDALKSVGCWTGRRKRMAILNQAAFDIGQMAHRMSEGYLMHLAVIQVATDPRSVALSPDVVRTRDRYGREHRGDSRSGRISREPPDR
jgi:hypothetical protein